MDDSVKFCPNCGTKTPSNDKRPRATTSDTSFFETHSDTSGFQAENPGSAFDTLSNKSGFQAENPSSAFETHEEGVSGFIADSAKSSIGKTSNEFTLIDDSKKTFVMRDEKKLDNQGAMGCVSSAIWTEGRSEKKVLLKRLFKPADANQEKLFSNEGFMSRDYGGSSIVKLYGKGETDEFYFMIMEFYEGQTLDKLINQGAYLKKIQPICTLIQEILKALGELHKAEVVHRDFKPANIIIRPNGKPVILDLGLACQPGLSDINGVKKIGTPKYAAPEQMRGTFSCASDIYSVGIIFLEMYTGKSDFDMVYSLPQPYKNFVMKCLAKEVGKRYANAEEALEALKATSEIKEVKKKNNINDEPDNNFSTVTILGYREPILFHSAVKIFCDGILTDEVQYCGKTEIKIKEPCDIYFKLQFKKTKPFRVNGGEWILLSWNGNDIDAFLTDKNSYQTDIVEVENAGHKRIIFAIIMTVLIILYNLGKRFLT